VRNRVEGGLTLVLVDLLVGLAELLQVRVTELVVSLDALVLLHHGDFVLKQLVVDAHHHVA
jgi:hypothetical protein